MELSLSYNEGDRQMSQKKMNRRDLLCASAAVMAGGKILASEALGAEGKATRLKAGVGKRDITGTKVNAMMDDPAMKAALGVTKANHKGVRVNDPLMVKVLVIDDGGMKFVLITLDVIAIGGIGELSESDSNLIRSKVAGELGISEGNVMMAASHTHLVGGQLSKNVVKLTVEAVKDAAANMEGVTVGAGKGFENTIAMNRRIRLKNGKAWTIRHANPCPPDEEVAGIGPMDPEVGVLRVDKADGSPLAVVYNYTCHPYTGLPAKGVTGEYPAYASKVIESTFEGSTAFFVQGACGDITEVLYKDTGRSRDCRPFGTALGVATVDAVRKIETKDGALKVISAKMDFPARTDWDKKFAALDAEEKKLLRSLAGTSMNCETFVPSYIKYSLDPKTPAYYSYRYMQEKEQGIEGLEQRDAEQRRNIGKYRRNMLAMEKLTRIQANRGMLSTRKKDIGGRSKINCQMQAIKIGDFHMITFPAEVFVQVGLNIKKNSAKSNTFFGGYANGYIHYTPVADEFDCDAYENYNCWLAAEWQDMFEKKALGMLAAL
jgi:hypothetical protein